ncbi:ornithine--oxo-acid transaminase [Isachenkonia alkalipeptolytica]|uniref:ornithine aminotransferase n=1 Tax=Isachenkonia alkalipeptolytica TaxID=2565777 RepID=A0AA43XJU8_9CLOT|nr:ornithine--oxo-acid transaminase [Isachenkonia alkalipeptolytica]NBG87519.1 ornithine--oxo-acid transaminase [Isachenkonia alkalipeptolytica]
MNQGEKIIEKTEEFSANNYHPLPLVIAKAEGSWVYDTEGNRYLDMIASYSALNHGHRHPKIIRALKDQADQLTLTSRALHNDQMGAFMEKLCTLSNFDKALPMNSGTEAVETALKAARRWGYEVKKIPKDKAEIIGAKNNFSGRSIGVLSMSTGKSATEGFGPFAPGFVTVPFGDGKAIEQAINENTAAVILEPIQGEGGVVVPPEGYLQEVREITKKHNVLLIIDEIQTGFGRTGKLYCYQHEDIQPDIVTVGKALGGGVYPVSAILADDDVMQVFQPGNHGSTFGGNPLAARIGRVSLEVLMEEGLIERAQELGPYFMEKLKAMNSPVIKDIRGKGLMVGVEIKEEAGTGRDFSEKLMDLGVLAKDTKAQTLRFAPPLNISKEDLDWGIDRMKMVFRG